MFHTSLLCANGQELSETQTHALLHTFMESRQETQSASAAEDSDKAVAEALEKCSELQRIMTRLIQTTVGVTRHHSSSESVMTASQQLDRSAAVPVLPLSDSIQIIASDIDRVAADVAALIQGPIVSQSLRQRRHISALQQSINILAADAKTPEVVSGQELMAILSSVAAGKDPESCTAEKKTDRRASWIDESCNLSSATLVTPQKRSSSSLLLWGSYKPSASPIIVKQMQRLPPAELERRALAVLHQQQRDGNASFADAALSTTSSKLQAAEVDASSVMTGLPPRPGSAAGSATSGRDGHAVPHTRVRPGSGGDKSAASTGRPSSGSPKAAARSLSRPSSGGQRSVGSILDAAPLVHVPPFPYAFSVYGQGTTATWWHTVIRHLQRGAGTTVLRVLGRAISPDTADAMLAEVSTEPPCLSALVQRVVASCPEDSTLYWVGCNPSGCTEATWQQAARAKQLSRNSRSSPRIAATMSTNPKRALYLLTERLQFASDRPDCGLLELLRRDKTKAQPMWVASQLRCCASNLARGGEKDDVAQKMPDLVPRPLGFPSPYVVALPKDKDEINDDGDDMPQSAFVTIDVSPHILAPTSYAIASIHPFHSGEAPRNWVLEGSADHGETWTTLRSHCADECIGHGSDFAVFDIPLVSSIQTTVCPPVASQSRVNGGANHRSSLEYGSSGELVFTSRFCGSMFRVRATGPNAMGTLSLQVASIELYGRLLTCGVRAKVCDDGDEDDDSRVTHASVFGSESSSPPSVAPPHLSTLRLAQFSPIPPPPSKGGKGKK